ncbi:hypothetical protein JQ554_12810 [Bradyrhizobium diazoefficiens]|nr:hypothetical protein [Bradyrhizobium diazoefficiens]UCF55079.1 MAG: hypothetical protein JSV48_13455 [Bradyrhizobium sp.]MBR0964622.1 hypothetical protein [Bradyrhizobium diazoefficiens]MBR0978795.1 hypothetical protein [Bradyrhizobium diazoefficiens]MBR1006609.1 hypothetical protein [Bradyrhizobium diazoefficiens]MBR1014535.1 hypothetical protein [Bradyrhizobium diazoefficiens]
MDDTDPKYWPTQLQEIFAAVGRAMEGNRLTPETLKLVRMPNDQFMISHVARNDVSRKTGYYQISTYGGRWTFRSGKLEKLCRAAARVALGQRRPTCTGK